MPAAPISIDELLAAARQRNLWPEAGSAVEQTAGDQAAEGRAPAESMLDQAAEALRQQTVRVLGARSSAAEPQLAKLFLQLDASEKRGDAKAIWAALDELEDQLEALLRD